MASDIPGGELDVCDAKQVAWMKRQRDPELWHAAAMALVVHLDDPQRFLPWLFRQAEVDRATAGYVFLGLDGIEWLKGQVDFVGERLQGPALFAAFEAIAERSESVGFANDMLGLPGGFEPVRLDCLQLIDGGAVVPGRLAPRTLVATPFPPERPGPYFLEDGWVCQG